MDDLIKRLRATHEWYMWAGDDQPSKGSPVDLCREAADALESASRAVAAWKAVEEHWWKPVVTKYADGSKQWRAYNFDGSPEPGRDWPDPITAVLEADKARKARES